MAGFRVDTNVDMPLRDGTVLRGDVWRADDDQPRGALLLRTPYQKEESMSDFLRVDTVMRAGYAVVIQDVRGRFASDGVWDGFGGGWSQERDDTYDSVEWVAAQPWCDGNVGLWGLAHNGIYSFIGAEAQPPHLRAVIAVMTGSERQRALDSRGAAHLQAALATYLFAVAAELPKRLADGTMTPEDAARVRAMFGDVERVAEFLPLRDLPTHHDLPQLPRTWDDFLTGRDAGTHEDFDYERIAVPTMVVGGWYDLATSAVVDEYVQLSTRSGGGDAVRAAHRMIMGPWTHGSGEPNQGELDFGYFSGARVRQSVAPWCLAFLGRHFGRGGDDAPPVRYFLMGANEWREAGTWPPEGVALQTWHLHSDGGANTLDGDGRLSREVPTNDQPPDQYRYDPLDPVRTRGGRVNRTGGAPGPIDQSIIERRDDVVCYTSDELDAPLEVVGLVSMQLFASSSAVDTDFFVKVLDVYPDGRVIEFASGLARARFRKGLDREVPLDPGVIEAYDIDLGPTAWRLGAGHRLRVHVCSSNFPFFDRNMNTGHALGVDAEGVVAEQAVFHDPANPSRLNLPVAPAAL